MERPFRFFDNREKYLMFVSTCTEKWAVAERVGIELAALAPMPPALRLFDAGVGDGTVLASVLRQVHEVYPSLPLFVVGKEISVEDVRMTLARLPDRFSEHPPMVVVITNLHYREAPWLWPDTAEKIAQLNWFECVLDGATAHEFDEQLKTLRPRIADWWRVQTSEKTGNPLYVTPSVLVIYRRDQRFGLDAVIPRRGDTERGYDLVIASQPYRTRSPAHAKCRYVLEPLARSLAPGGRMITIQSTGQDPGMEIIRTVWPQEAPFQTPGPMLLGVLRNRLGDALPDLRFPSETDRHALFRFSLYTTPREVSEPINASTLLAAWNAATYVAQIDDEQVAESMTHNDYLDATREVLRRHGGLWFTDESFLVTRNAS